MVDVVVGMDPGKDGGLVAVTRPGLVSTSARMPVVRTTKSDGGERTVVDAEKVAAFLKSSGAQRVVIEDVWSSPQMGVVGAFSFGDSKGVLRGVCAGLGLPVAFVAPLTWKGRMGVLVPRRPGVSKKDHKKALKAAAIARAQVLFPGAAGMDHDGVAEAALMAAYGLMFLPATLPQTDRTGGPTARPRNRKLTRQEVRRIVNK